VSSNSKVQSESGQIYLNFSEGEGLLIDFERALKFFIRLKQGLVASLSINAFEALSTEPSKLITATLTADLVFLQVSSTEQNSSDSFRWTEGLGFEYWGVLPSLFFIIND
jgi:hypothetical protein